MPKGRGFFPFSMMTPEQIEAEFKHVATKADLHKELHAQTRQFVTWMGVMTVVILGGVYFFLNFALGDIKNDVREIRNRLPATQTK
jgi:hypothetical protein